MPEYRIEGLTLSGKVVSGSISADTKSIAKKRAQELGRDKKFKITDIHERVAYIYRVQKGTDKPIDGEQKAFTAAEVRTALEKMGFKVIYVRRKLFGTKQKAAPATEIITFVRVSTDLMRQKLPFNEVMQLLINDITNSTLREAVKEINTELKQGKDSEKVFQKQSTVFGKFAANMLGLASKSGNMVEIYESTAKFLERNAEFKRSLKSALVTPMITLLVLFFACLFYVAYIFPKTAEMFVKFHIKLPPMTAATLKFSDWLMANVKVISVLTVGPIIGLIMYLKTERGQFFMDKYMIRIPVLGTLFHKMAIEIFCRVFYALYSGSGENIEIIRMAAEACGNRYMEHQIKTVAIPMMLERGRGLTEAFEATGVFTRTAISRFNSGAETGTVKTTALQLAEYYEKETSYKLKNAVEAISLSVNMIIMIVLTALTLVSSETAMVKPESPHMIMPVGIFLR
jgi:type IV pilus assembly protein PilC